MKIKMLFTLCLSGLLAVSLAGIALASSNLGSKADIPFEFYVGVTRFSSGEVTATQAGIINMLQLSNLDDKSTAFVLSMRGDIPTNTEKKARFVFHKHGNQYFLREVWLNGGQTGYIFPVSRMEKELMSHDQAKGDSRQNIEIAAR
jgi:hypothetical protein